ncbi:MAG: hypothetical protein J0L67_18470 [Cytophagales bacterium]|nr:hypothetical protein [Cytophagales bacterium]
MENSKTPLTKKVNGLLAAYAFFITVISILFTTYLYDNNLELQNAVGQRDTMIASIQRGDSLYKSTVKGYSEVITRYVSDCSFVIDGKKISTQDLVKLLNEILNQNESLADSVLYYKKLAIVDNFYKNEYQKRINSMMDSLVINSKIVELAKRDYGVNYKVEKSQSGFTFVREISKADSAIILFPYYKDKLKRDTLTDSWIITTQTRTIIQDTPKRKKKDRKTN